MDRPIFGEKKQFAGYQTRYAAYTVIERDQQTIIIEVPDGAFFLLGGKIEGEETKEKAVVRELIEEMGIMAGTSPYLGGADKYFYSNYRATHYYNPGYLFVADFWEHIGEPTEETNKIQWVSPQEVLVKLKRGSYRWVVERWIEKNRN